MMHFATADEPAQGIDWQLDRFRSATRDLGLPVTLANSAALLDYPGVRGDWVRPGIMLYGSSPFADRSAADLGLIPAMTLTSRIIGVQELAVDNVVGHGAAVHAPSGRCGSASWLAVMLMAILATRRPGPRLWWMDSAPGWLAAFRWICWWSI